MRHAALAVVVCLATCVFIAAPVATAQQAQPTTVSTTKPTTTIDEVMKEVRADLQGQRSDIMAKNMTLTSEQAAKFWPLFAEYQKQQNVVMDDQMRGIQKFIEGFDSLDDAGALALINGHFERDEKMNALRRKWLGEFQKVLGTKLAVRAMQIDRRLSLMQQIEFASKIPLAH